LDEEYPSIKKLRRKYTMKFGVREICDVVLKAKAATKIGNKIFYKNEPVIYFDTLKTSSMEGAATTVYAQGGRGNARLVAWEGERTVTFTMEDALISPEGFMILSGAGLIEATTDKTIKQHITETVDKSDVTVTGTEAASAVYTVKLTKKPYLPADAGEDFAYVMFVRMARLSLSHLSQYMRISLLMKMVSIPLQSKHMTTTILLTMFQISIILQHFIQSMTSIVLL
jgi:hypothetical protein